MYDNANNSQNLSAKFSTHPMLKSSHNTIRCVAVGNRFPLLRGLKRGTKLCTSAILYSVAWGNWKIRGCIQTFPDWVDNEINNNNNNNNNNNKHCWEATQRVMAAKLTRLTHTIAIQLHLVAESCTICSSRCRRPVRKLFVIPSYLYVPRLGEYRDKITCSSSVFLMFAMRGLWCQ
jgi:hypothetical protein